MATKFVEFGGGAGAESLTLPVPSAVPIGSTLIVSVSSIGNTNHPNGISVTDTKSNVWNSAAPSFNTGTTSLTIGMSVITSALSTSDSVTVTSLVPSGAVTKISVSIIGIDAKLKALGYNSTSNSDASSVTWTPSVAMESAFSISAMGMVNIGRTLTVDSPYVLGTKYASATGSGDRAVATAWKLSNSSPSTSSTLRYSSSGTGVATVVALDLDSEVVPPTRSGLVKVYQGGSWVSHPAKSIIGGVQTPGKAKAFIGGTWITAK